LSMLNLDLSDFKASNSSAAVNLILIVLCKSF
jgi:hypothetical protein